MKGSTLFMKLKSISSPTWNPIQLFHTSTPAKEHYICATNDILEDFDDEKSVSGPNAEEKLAFSINTKPDKFGSAGSQEQVQLLPELYSSVEMVTSCCQSTAVVHIKSSHDSIESIQQLPFFKPKYMEDHIHHNAKNDELHLPKFEEKCPPGGKDTVIFYMTSLRGIRKTFEDCNKIRFLLESFRVMYYERDVSMDLKYREELWEMLGGRVVPPRLFIRGKYIGGAEEVVGLHEKGMLRNLLEGIALTASDSPCQSCGGLRFVMCWRCNGSRKTLGESDAPVKCCDCNENGLVRCSVCS